MDTSKTVTLVMNVNGNVKIVKFPLTIVLNVDMTEKMPQFVNV
jgi:hypothetical protein